jgi:hypothetical protein
LFSLTATILPVVQECRAREPSEIHGEQRIDDGVPHDLPQGPIGEIDAVIGHQQEAVRAGVVREAGRRATQPEIQRPALDDRERGSVVQGTDAGAGSTVAWSGFSIAHRPRIEIGAAEYSSSDQTQYRGLKENRTGSAWPT